MDQNPFQTPYQLQPAPGVNNQSIKPFAAKDLAPAASPQPIAGPAQSPFLNPGFDGPFNQRNSASANPASSPNPGPGQGGHNQVERRGGNAFIGKPAPMELHDDISPLQPASTPQPQSAQPFPAKPSAPQAAPQNQPAPIQNWTAAPQSPTAIPMPAAARESQIKAVSGAATAVRPRFFLSTAHNVDGFKIQTYLGVVSVEVVVPKDLLFRNPAAYGELHRIKAAEDQLQLVKNKAMEELAERAQQMQADGIVGITLQFSQFDAIVCLCSAVGTAVQLAS